MSFQLLPGTTVLAAHPLPDPAASGRIILVYRPHDRLTPYATYLEHPHDQTEPWSLGHYFATEAPARRDFWRRVAERYAAYADACRRRADDATLRRG